MHALSVASNCLLADTLCLSGHLPESQHASDLSKKPAHSVLNHTVLASMLAGLSTVLSLSKVAACC